MHSKITSLIIRAVTYKYLTSIKSFQFLQTTMNDDSTSDPLKAFENEILSNAVVDPMPALERQIVNELYDILVVSEIFIRKEITSYISNLHTNNLKTILANLVKSNALINIFKARVK